MDVEAIVNDKKFLVILFIVSLAARLLVFYGIMRYGDNVWMYPDSVQYHETASSIASGRGVVATDGSPQMYRLPGYPLFLAAVYSLSNDSVHVAMLVQLILSCLIPLLVFMLALMVSSNVWIAQGAALVCAVHSGFLYYASMLTTETLFLVVWLCFLLIFFSAHRLRNFFLAGIMLGIVALVRPVGHYALIVSLFVIIVKQSSWQQWCMRGALLTLGWLVAVAPWLIRNFMLTGALFFHTLPGHHFLQYSAAYVLMERDGISYSQARQQLLTEWASDIKDFEKKEGKKANNYERCRLAENIAYPLMFAHLWHTCKTATVQLIKTCCALYSAQPLLSDSGQWPEYTETTTVWTKIKRFLLPTVKHKMLIFFIYWEIVCFLLLCLGLLFVSVQVFYDRRICAMTLAFVPYFLMFIGITISYGCARLRFPIEPLVIIMSCAGWQWIYTQFYRRKNMS